MKLNFFHMNHAEAKKIVLETLNQYDRIAPEFAATRYTSLDFTALSRYVKRDDMVLDLGCGNGRLLGVLRNFGVKYLGADGSKKLIEIAQATYAQDIKDGTAGFVTADLFDLPFDAHQFSTVFCMAVLHHVPSESLRRRAFEILFHQTADGGRCIGTVWNLRSDYFVKRYHLAEQLHTPPQGLESGDVYIPWKASGEAEQRYCHAFTLAELEECARAAGWKIHALHAATRSFERASIEEGPQLFWELHR